MNKINGSDKKDSVHMVDISEKNAVKRIATAKGTIWLKPTTIEKIKNNQIKKGDVFSVSETAAILAVKKTPEYIPLCHQIPIQKVDASSEVFSDHVTVHVSVITIANTGVEMEALVGVSAYLMNLWDMTKYLEKDSTGQYPTTKISDIIVIHKKKEE